MIRPAARALISDFGGVLTVPLLDAFTAFHDTSGIAPGDLGRALQAVTEETGVNPLHELERGEVSESEFNRRLEAHLPEGGSLGGFRDTWFEALHPNETLISYMAGLRARGIRTALLTNNVREWEPLWRAKLAVDDIFEVVVDSAFVGMRKPEPEIYTLTLERIGGGIEAGDCVFLDDLTVNVEAANDAGMRGVLFESTEQSIAAIETELSPRS
ncbi:MAG TPA: HAD family phosphatase [Thermoleophilaceae bacterium]|nr:HAD family phosphatase [Thermoleophilaceae bacterium]